MHRKSRSTLPASVDFSRRHFVQGAVAAAAAAPWAATAAQPGGATDGGAKRRIKIGLIGNGGRGKWIASLFAKHGGYELHAVADYFQEAADRCGDAFGVDKARRFPGLEGYKRVLESGVEAVVLKTPTCFFAQHAAAAIEAGVHVYMAKPVAVDVPGCMKIQSLGKEATGKKLVMLVDYQLPTDPANQQVRTAIGQERFGPLARIITTGISGGHTDPAKTDNIESRLQHLVWCNDVALGGGYLLTYDIHALDAAVWTIGRRPVAAMGLSRIVRPDPHGDSHDVTSVVYEYADGLIHEHFGQALPNRTPNELSCKLYSYAAQAMVAYKGNAFYEIRGQKRIEAPIENLYPAGASRNIADFYTAITEGQHENRTVPRAVEGCLMGILGREACVRRQRLTMAELLKENKRIEVDLSGLKR